MAVIELNYDTGALLLMNLIGDSRVKKFHNSGSKIFMIEFENGIIVNLVFEKNGQRFSIENQKVI